jgi:hypothetical protein
VNRERPFRALIAAVVARNPDASMVGIVRAFPMTWWTTWACIVLASAMGGIYLLQGATRFASPAYSQAKALLTYLPGDPMRAWGLVFLLLSVAQFLAMRASLTWLVRTMRVAATVYVFYGVLFFAAAMADDRASLVGLPIYLFVATIHLAIAETVSMIHRGAKR